MFWLTSALLQITNPRHGAARRSRKQNGSRAFCPQPRRTRLPVSSSTADSLSERAAAGKAAVRKIGAARDALDKY